MFTQVPVPSKEFYFIDHISAKKCYISRNDYGGFNLRVVDKNNIEEIYEFRRSEKIAIRLLYESKNTGKILNIQKYQISLNVDNTLLENDYYFTFKLTNYSVELNALYFVEVTSKF